MTTVSSLVTDNVQTLTANGIDQVICATQLQLGIYKRLN